MATGIRSGKAQDKRRGEAFSLAGWPRWSALLILLSLLIAAASASSPDIHGPEAHRPFTLPFKEPPGPDTWLLAQVYGNTTSAYTQRDTTYQAGQGIHFGVDFSAPCGTEITAIGDGLVFAVDNLGFGSGPHNLMIDHPDLGYSSFYGHLLNKPSLTVGQAVRQGEVVALSGDPAETCYGRPHLHLEIRDLRHWRKYNPLLLIQADWDNLALIGPFSGSFERDLDEPRKWQQPDDQPEVIIGGPLINDFAHPWPPDWRNLSPVASPSPTDEARPVVTPTVSIAGTPQPTGSSTSALRQLTQGGCCTQPFWSPDSRRVLFIDKPNPAAPTGIWGVDVARPGSTPELLTRRVAFYTDDLAFLIEMSKGVTIIERDPLEEQGGERWQVPANGQQVYVSPGQKRIAWQATNPSLPFERRSAQVWVADLSGTNPRKITTLNRGGFVAWVSDEILLLNGRESLQAREQVLYTFSLADGRTVELARSERLRGGVLSPGGSWLAYYVAPGKDRDEDGLWLVRTDGSKRRKLPGEMFGAYRWRSGDRLLIVPFRPNASSQELWELDADSWESHRLVNPETTPFKIANGDWTVSPDGRYLAFVGSGDRNLWLLKLAD